MPVPSPLLFFKIMEFGNHNQSGLQSPLRSDHALLEQEVRRTRPPRTHDEERPSSSSRTGPVDTPAVEGAPSAADIGLFDEDCDRSCERGRGAAYDGPEPTEAELEAGYASLEELDLNPVVDGLSHQILDPFEGEPPPGAQVPVHSRVLFEGCADGHLYLSEKWIVESCRFPGGYQGFRRFRAEQHVRQYRLRGRLRYRLTELNCAVMAMVYSMRME